MGFAVHNLLGERNPYSVAPRLVVIPTTSSIIPAFAGIHYGKIFSPPTTTDLPDHVTGTNRIVSHSRTPDRLWLRRGKQSRARRGRRNGAVALGGRASRSTNRSRPPRCAGGIYRTYHPSRAESASGALMRPLEAPESLMRLIRGKGSPEEPHLPPGYVLDCSDPDVLILHCPQGTVIARFSARGATTEAIEREARTHHRERNRSA